MASEKQVAANRANAKRSTGPKAAAGKALSRMNLGQHQQQPACPSQHQIYVVPLSLI